jgi:hypothetical protein
MDCFLSHLSRIATFFVWGEFGAILCPSLLYILYLAQKGQA